MFPGRVIGRILRRTFRRPARTFLPLVLAPALAIGSLTLSPSSAYAAIPQVSTALPDGRVIPATTMASGSTLVWDTLRSSDGGSTWHADAAIADRPYWDFVGRGKMARVIPGSGDTDTAVVYTPPSGTPQTYTIPGGPWAVNSTYATYGTSIRNLATGSTSNVIQPTGTATYWTQELSSNNAILWHGTTSDDLFTLFAVSPTPSAAPGAWVSLTDTKAHQLTATDLLYLVANTSTVSLCRRSLTAFSATPTCITVASGNYSTGYTLTINSLGSLTLVHIQDFAGTVDKAYVVSGSMTTVSPVQLPAGSTVYGAVHGESPYLVVVDANTVPAVKIVAANGSLTSSFAIPQTEKAAPSYLAVTPDRVVGGDSRDGSQSVPVWTRTVSSSGFGGETALPGRASGLTASAGRTAVMGRTGVSVYDRGTLQHTFGDQAQLSDVQLSGPYVVERLVDTSRNAYTKVSKADGTQTQQFMGWPSGVFGSQYVSTSVDPTPTGAMHVVVRDLTGATANAAYTLPAGTADCYAMDVWGSAIALYCTDTPWANTTRVYDYRTGQLLGSTSGMAESLGDGYAVVNTGSTYSVWNIAANSQNSTGCNSMNAIEATDGVGHVVCGSDTDLIRQDYSSLSRSAPRLLGILADSSAGFSEPGSTWTLAIDTTKALQAGQVLISNAIGKPVRSLPTLASADGSIRVTWDGLDDAGHPVPAGPYTSKLVASAADGTGAVVSITGTGTASTTLTVTAASTKDMGSGGFANLPPSRLLDTRVTGPKLGSAQTRSLKVTGVGGVPSTGVSAVVLNVTVTETTNSGYLTVSPTGTPRPVVSNLNWSAGTTIPNAVTVRVGTGGSIDLYQSGPGTAQVIVDVAGYYIAGTVAAAGGFTSLTPHRILDTRNNGGKLASGETRAIPILGQGNVPSSNVSAVVLNVTVTETTSGGYLSVYPAESIKPKASNLNWNSGGTTIPNLVVVKVGSNGKVSLFQSGPGTAQVIVDVAGYYRGGTAAKPGMFVAMAPTRVLDTRSTRPVAGGANISLTILDKGGIPPTGVSAVVINTTVTETKAPGYLTVFPGTNPLPTASNLNWSGPSITIPNLVTVQLGSDGAIRFYNGSSGTTQVIADTAGYYISY